MPARLSDDSVVFRHVFEQLDQGVLVAAGRRVLFVNRAFAALMGRQPDDLTGVPLEQVLAAGDGQHIEDLSHETCTVSQVTVRLRHRSGAVLPLALSLKPCFVPDLGRCLVCTTVAPHAGAMVPTNQAAALFHADEPAPLPALARDAPGPDVDQIPDIYFRTDASGRLTRVNAAVRDLGWTPEEVVGRRLSALYAHPMERHRLVSAMRAIGGHTRVEVAVRRRDGSVAWLESRFRRRVDSLGRFVGVEGIARDVTERRRAEDSLRRAAGRDPLTGLPNRDRALKRLDRAAARARRRGERLAVLFIDLDGFKPVNDTHGHAAGDAVLRIVAERVAQAVRETDTAARLGGDEFMVLLENDPTPELAAWVADRILADLAAPYEVDGVGMTTLSASIGIALLPDHTEDPQQLVHLADQAMYAAKRGGRGRVVLHGGPPSTPAH